MAILNYKKNHKNLIIRMARNSIRLNKKKERINKILIIESCYIFPFSLF